MANLYVKSTGSNTAPYDTWAKAATNPTTAVNAAAAGDNVYIFAESFVIGVNETWVLAGTVTNPVKVFCVTDTAEPPTTLGVAKYTQTTTSFDLVIQGIGYVYGFTYETTGASSTACTLGLATSSDDDLTLENFGYVLASTNTAGTSIVTIGTGAGNSAKCRLVNPTITFGNATGQYIAINVPLEIQGGTISSAASLTSLFRIIAKSGAVRLEGTDLSGMAGTIYNPGSSTFDGSVEMRNFRHHASATIVGAYTALNQPEAFLSNYSSGDVHYNFAHYNVRGSTIMETGIYANDGQTYDGTNKITWKIVTTSFASQFQPYVSPWIEQYHSATAAITPRFEILRDGSTTPYTNQEVWAEFGYQGTNASTRSTFVNDEGSLLGAGANQDAGVGVAGWTGDTGAWSGKIDSGSAITPAEIGMLRGRVYVGRSASTVYVDPQIRT